MKHSETYSKANLIIERPLFSSTLLALFTVLRKSYNERNVVAAPGAVKLKTSAEKQSDIKLN